MGQLKASHAALVQVIEMIEPSLKTMPSFTGEKRRNLTVFAQFVHMGSAGGEADIFPLRQFIEGFQLLLTIGPSFAFGQLPIGYYYSFGIASQKFGITNDTEKCRRQTSVAHLGCGFCEGLIAGVVCHPRL